MKKIITSMVLFAIAIVPLTSNAQNQVNLTKNPSALYTEGSLNISFDLEGIHNLPVVSDIKVYNNDMPLSQYLLIQKKDTFPERIGLKQISFENFNLTDTVLFIWITVGYLDSSSAGSMYIFKKSEILGFSFLKEDVILFVYPNPTSNVMNITTQEPGIVFIYDVNGKRVLGTPVKNGENLINIESLAKGFYIIELNSEKLSGNSYSRSIILKE